jgi:hypothetical protein
MADFITRVELHDADWSDYERLHAAMEAEKFYRVIKGSNDKWYHLPTAEYHSTGTLSAEDVRELAKKAAAKTGKSFSVLVSQATDIVWYNLPEVT